MAVSTLCVAALPVRSHRAAKMHRSVTFGLGVAAVMVGVGCGSQASSPVAKPLTRASEPLSKRRADALAAMLQRRVRHSRPVPYNVNLSIEWLAHRANGQPLRESTSSPLDYHSGDSEQYFRLEGYSLPKLRVRPILGHIATVHESWNFQRRTVTAMSHKGVITLSRITHIPGVTIHLSNGINEGVAIAQTSATP